MAASGISEEWETRKKKEITTTRQIETRVKRQVVLEDGEVVVDSGPLVTTNTTEDVEQREHKTQEVCVHLQNNSKFLRCFFIGFLFYIIPEYICIFLKFIVISWHRESETKKSQ